MYVFTLAIFFLRSTGQVYLEEEAKNETREHLAPTTVVPTGVSKDDVFGAIISYIIRVKVSLGVIYGDVALDLPFLLTRKPEVNI